MNRQRKVVITITYNEMGIIIDTKAEELDLSAQPEIVRCKDCKYLLPKGSFCSKDMCCLRGMAHYRHVDIHNDFCSWAERRKDGEI